MFDSLSSITAVFYLCYNYPKPRAVLPLLKEDQFMKIIILHMKLTKYDIYVSRKSNQLTILPQKMTRFEHINKETIVSYLDRLIICNFEILYILPKVIRHWEVIDSKLILLGVIFFEEKKHELFKS